MTLPELAAAIDAFLAAARACPERRYALKRAQMDIQTDGCRRNYADAYPLADQELRVDAGPYHTITRLRALIGTTRSGQQLTVSYSVMVRTSLRDSRGNTVESIHPYLRLDRDSPGLEAANAIAEAFSQRAQFIDKDIARLIESARQLRAAATLAPAETA